MQVNGETLKLVDNLSILGVLDAHFTEETLKVAKGFSPDSRVIRPHLPVDAAKLYNGSFLLFKLVHLWK